MIRLKDHMIRYKNSKRTLSMRCDGKRHLIGDVLAIMHFTIFWVDLIFVHRNPWWEYTYYYDVTHTYHKNTFLYGISIDGYQPYFLANKYLPRDGTRYPTLFSCALPIFKFHALLNFFLYRILHKTPRMFVHYIKDMHKNNLWYMLNFLTFREQ